MTNVWVEAARPRTLPAALAPVLVGTAAASTFIAWRAAAALVVALALQVAVNFANDYFDGVRGVDSPERTGPRRAVAAGLVPPAAMKRAVIIALVVAATAGATLVVAVGPVLLAVGAACVAAALGYSGGPRPYASAGLGEVFVFVFFGLVATAGTQYVLDERLATVSVVASVPVGLLAVALLVVNNLRDIPTDRVAGKRTLAVRLGERPTRTLYVGLVWGAVLAVGAVAAVAGSAWPLVALLVGPLAAHAARTVRNAPLGPALVPALERTARLHLALGALLALGLAVR